MHVYAQTCMQIKHNTILKSHLCIYFVLRRSGEVPMSQNTYEGQWAMCGTQISSSTMWVPEIELRLSTLATLLSQLTEPSIRICVWVNNPKHGLVPSTVNVINSYMYPTHSSDGLPTMTQPVALHQCTELRSSAVHTVAWVLRLV